MMNPSALIAALLGETLSSQERLVGFQPANVGRVGRPGAGPERKRIFLCEGE